MATYDITGEQNSPSPKPGTFWKFAILDFRKHNAAQNDIFRIMKLRKGWQVVDSWYKIAVSSTAGADWEIGYAGATTDIKDVATTTSTTEWTTGSEKEAAAYAVAADKFVEVKVTDAAEYEGVLYVMIKIFAGFDENEPADADIT